jgi:hypothetical protein
MWLTQPSTINANVLNSTKAIPQGADAYLKNNNRFVSNPASLNVAGQFSFILLFNPAASGVDIYLDFFWFTSGAAGNLFVYQVSATAGVQQAAPTPVRRAGAAGQGQIWTGSEAAGTGTQIDALSVTGSVRVEWYMPYPFYLAPGDGVKLEQAIANSQLTGLLRHRELS